MTPPNGAPAISTLFLRDTHLHAVTLTEPTGTVTQTTELSTAQQGILRACGLTPSPGSQPWIRRDLHKRRGDHRRDV
jgi:hypothetical protein